MISSRVLFLTLYRTGLHLGEGLRLQVSDIDAARARVHVRNAKGNRDRLVPLPTTNHKAKAIGAASILALRDAGGGRVIVGSGGHPEQVELRGPAVRVRR